MSNILSIQSSARHDGSFSRDLSAELIAKLNIGGNHSIVERDLADAVAHVDDQWLGANWTPKADRTDAQRAQLAKSDGLVEELKSADILVIGSPIYNFSVPAALKAWIDMICRAGETFRYTESGPQGLLKGKKAYIVIASGGVPIDSPVDFATPYLRQVMRFIGVTDIEIIGATGMVQNADEGLAKARETISNLAA